MKTSKISIIGLLLIALAFSSCKKWIDEDINVDPNNPSDVSLDLLLPSIQASWAYTLGGDVQIESRIWMQQLAGVDRQALSYGRYTVTSSDVNNIWRFDTYASSIMDTKIMIKKAEEQASPAYKAIGLILWGYQFQVLTDYFGDMPYSEALDPQNIQPKFDTQESIIADLVSKIDTAIAIIHNTSVYSPSSDDLIYGGTTPNYWDEVGSFKWEKAAYALKARLLIRWGQKDASKLALVQDAIDNALTSVDDDMKFTFGSTEENGNPLYQFLTQRAGYVLLGEYFINQMNGETPDDQTDDDPRLSVYALTDGSDAYTGVPPGTVSADASAPGDFFALIDAPVYFMTYAEMKFLEAEINTGADRDAAYKAGVTASLEMTGVLGTNTTWEDANINSVADVSLEQVMNAKYLGLAMQSEVFADYRRTGFPALEGYNGGDIPKRYPYPSAEYDYNPDNVPANVNLNTPVWWNTGSK
jgi:hypothetical protein